MYMYVYVLDANTESQISSVSMPIPIATKPGSIIEKTCECVNVMKRLLSYGICMHNVVISCYRVSAACQWLPPHYMLQPFSYYITGHIRTIIYLAIIL